MKGWIDTTLGKVSSDISYGYTQSASQQMIGPKFLRITDIQHDFIDWSSVPYCKISEADHSKYKLSVGDVVIARTGNSTGATAVIKEEIEAVFASYLIRFKLKMNVADYKFIDFLLRSSKWENFVRSIKGGSAQDGANAKQFAKFQIFLPPLPEQKAIAAVLSCLDDKIELLNKQNKTLEKIAQTLFKRWFVEFEFPTEDGKPYKSSGGKMVENEMGEIPEFWKVTTISEFIKELESGRRPKGGVGQINSGVPSIGAESINGICDFDYSKIKFIPEKFFNSMKFGIVKNYDILVYKDGGLPGTFIPKFSIFGEGFPFNRLAINEHVFRVQANKKERQFFLYLWLDSYLCRKELEVIGVKAAVPGINSKDFCDLTMFQPNEEVLNKFNKIVTPMFRKILRNNCQKRTLASLRDTLLPKLMSGKIRVKY